MGSFRKLVLSLALFWGTISGAQQTVPVTILSRSSSQLPEFDSSNFAASSKGKIIQVSSVAHAVEPGRVIVLLDVSYSMLGTTTSADWNFPIDLARVLFIKMPPEVEVGLSVFATELGRGVGLTSDREKVIDELEDIRKVGMKFGDGETSVWDSIIAGAKLFARPRVGDSLYLISDGIDTMSKASFRDVVQALDCRGIRLFAFQLADRRKTDRSITTASTAAHRQLLELTQDTGGVVASALRPSSAMSPTWDFVDKSGQPTELTTSLFAQYRVMLSVYDVGIELSERLYKPQDFNLELKGIDSARKSDLVIVYPKKLVPCY